MKKIFLTVAGLVLVSGFVAGCSNKQTDETKDSSSESKSSQTASSASNTSQNSGKSEGTKESNSSNESVSTDNETKDTPEQQEEVVMGVLAESFPQDSLPTAILTSTTKDYVSAATTSIENKENYRILYYAEAHPITVNNTELNSLKPIGAFERMTFSTEEEAKNEVGKVEDYSGQEVDLGYGLTGYTQGAAGSIYLTWAEGNWAITVRASNIEGEDPVPLGKETVAYLENNTLPAPVSDGSIQLNVGENGDYQTNSVVWQEKNIVYKIHHFSGIQAVKMAVSTNK